LLKLKIAVGAKNNECCTDRQICDQDFRKSRINGSDICELGKDLGEWNMRMAELMPSGRGGISPGPAARREI